MKVARVLLISAGLLAILLLIAVGVALNSSFQTWAARRALAAQGDVKGTIGEVAAGFRRTEVKDVRLASRGAVLTLPSATVELPLLSAGLSQRIFVTRLVAKGWTLDLSNVPNLAHVLPELGALQNAFASERPREFSLLPSAYAAEAAAERAFRGVFADLRLPVDVALDGVELEGEVIVPAPGEPAPVRVKVNLRGGGLAAGREGQFALELAAAKGDGGALTLHSDLFARMDTPRTFTRLGAKAAAAASGTQIPNGVKLDIETAAVRTVDGEDYTLTLSAGGKTLADLAGSLSHATGRIGGTWALDLRGSDLSPFALGRRLPVFAAEGEGEFETGPTFEEVHAHGALIASASGLEVLQPELAAIGEVSLTADFDVLQHGESLRVERFDAAVSGASPVAAVRALQPFEFNLTTAQLNVADPSQDLVGVVLHGVPLAWARLFLGEFELSGGDLRGEFAASAREGGLGLRAKTPLTVAALTVAQAGDVWLRDLDLALDASADYTPQGWQAQVVSLGVRSKGATLLTLDAKAGRLAGEKQPVKLTGRWSADLAGWMAQPALAGQLALARGHAQGDFAASLDGTQAIEAKLAVSRLVAATSEPLPDFALDVRADIAPTGVTTLSAPLTVTMGARKSDVALAGTLTPKGSALTLDARVTGELVHVQDMQLLALALPAGDAAQTKVEEKKGEGPFWQNVNGQVSLALKRVLYGDTFEVTNVGGTLRIDASSLKLDGVRAVFGPESDLKLNGGLKFEAATPQPYVLAADVTVTNFDTGPAFRAIDPAKLPTVEARVNLTSHVAGRGADLVEMAERASGDLQVTGKSGVFRALSADLSDKVQRTQSTVAAIGGIIGAVTGKQEYADMANKTQILGDIAKALAEIPFDQLNVTASRGADLNLVLKDFTLISPEVRLTGGGAIRYVEGTPLLAQPLSVELNLGARGQLADLLKRAGLLEARADNLGYAAFVTPIKVAGSLAKTDTTELRNALLNSALEKSGLLDNLLRK